MRPNRLLFAFGALALIVAGCGDDSVPSAVTSIPTAEPPDGAWQAVAGTVAGTPVELLDDHAVTLTIDASQIGGTAACNGYGGTAAFVDGTFSVVELSWTEMGCEPQVMELEQTYLQSLPGLTSYVLGGDTLTLAGPSAEWVFERLAPVPTAELVGTRWVLDTYIEDDGIEGDSASNMPGMEDATLTLDADGTLTGSTGCRQLSGTWIESGAEILFTDFAAEGDCPSERRDLDAAVVGVLGDGFTVEIEGRRLTVMASGGEGLSFTAA